MGVRRELLPWLGAFLTSRRQLSRVHGTLSGWRTVTCMGPKVPNWGLWSSWPWLMMSPPTTRTGGKSWMTSRWQWRPMEKQVGSLQNSGVNGQSICPGKKGPHDGQSEEMFHHADDLLPQSTCCRSNCNNTISRQVETLKLLVVTIQSDSKWSSHAESIISKTNCWKYFVPVLKRAVVGQQHFMNVYCTVIRPVLEYAVHAWHPGLIEVQAEQIERVRKQVLRLILPDRSYHDALLATGLQTLAERRVDLCRRFATHLMMDPELRTWLPPTRAVRSYGLSLRDSCWLTSLPA